MLQARQLDALDGHGAGGEIAHVVAVVDGKGQRHVVRHLAPDPNAARREVARADRAARVRR